MAHAYCYAQRTADDRIAIGGRGVPYRYGSKTDNDGATHAKTIQLLRDVVVRLFPQLAETHIDHAWSGVLGVPRDWCSTVGPRCHDRARVGRGIRGSRGCDNEPGRPNAR